MARLPGAERAHLRKKAGGGGALAPHWRRKRPSHERLPPRAEAAEAAIAAIAGAHDHHPLRLALRHALDPPLGTRVGVAHCFEEGLGRIARDVGKLEPIAVKVLAQRAAAVRRAPRAAVEHGASGAHDHNPRDRLEQLVRRLMHSHQDGGARGREWRRCFAHRPAGALAAVVARSRLCGAERAYLPRKRKLATAGCAGSTSAAARTTAARTTAARTTAARTTAHGTGCSASSSTRGKALVRRS